MIVIDIETMGNVEAICLLPEPEVAVGNLKDPEKIAAKITEAKNKQIEKLALNPLTGIIASLAYIKCDGERKVLFGEDNILDWFGEQLKENPLFITFNGKSFDIPYLFKRGIINNKLWANLRFMQPYVSKYTISNHIDVKQEWDINYGEHTSLKTLSNFLLAKDKPDFNFSEIPELLKTEEGRNVIASYNLNDAELTLELAVKMGLYE